MTGLSASSGTIVRPRPRRALRWAGVVRRHKAATAGGALLLLFTIVAIAAPLIAPHSIDRQAGPIFGRPSWAHPLGLDDGGIDVLSLIIAGARISMLVGIVATVVAVVIGGTVGVVAGYLGGWADAVLMRITDYFIIVPPLPLMIVIAEVWGPSLSHAIIVIGVLLWTPTARVVRAQVLSVRQRAFVQRSRALGAGHVRIVWHHVLPQVRSLLVANAVITVAAAIFYEAALAFLGLENPSSVSWGILIEHAFARAAVSAGAWWAIVPPGLCIALVVLGCNLIGMAVEDSDGPRASHVSAKRVRIRSRA